MSVSPRSEKFNIASNDHGRTQKCDFCISVCKTSFTDYYIPDTIHSFRDSVLVCLMHDTQKSRAFPFLAPCQQAIQAIAIVRLVT